MKNKIITRKTILSELEDYFEGNKSLEDLEKFASDALFVNEESVFDRKEPHVIKSAVWFLHETELPWKEYIEQVDIRILSKILVDVTDASLAVELISLLDYRPIIIEMIRDYLSGNISIDQLDLSIGKWSHVLSREVFKNILSNSKYDPTVLNLILDDFEKGNIESIKKILKTKYEVY